MTATARDPWFFVLCGAAGLLLGALYVGGALTGQVVPDTSSYFATPVSGQPWGEPRHPAYGYVASWLGASANTTGHVALAQGVLHVIASLFFYSAARRGGIGAIGAFALGIAALLSQSALLNLRLILPEATANSLLLLAFGCALAASRSARAFRVLVLPAVLFVGAAYTLRPSHLPAIVIIPALYWLFAWRSRQNHRTLRAAVLLIAAAMPFLAQSAIRYRAVGDFNIVSFGGYQMSSMAAFMLTPEIIARLPERVRPAAQEILAAREVGENEGTVARTPLNSSRQRSFMSAAFGYFDIYARSYDDLLGLIAKTRHSDENWVAFNARLMELSLATVAAAPQQWIAWVGGAASRLVGRAVVANAPMLAALLLLLIAVARMFLRRSSIGTACDDVALASTVALGWFVCTGSLTVLLTFPATRYIDTAAMLLPAIPLSLAIAMFREAMPPNDRSPAQGC
jgi:hypothetical protein